jgi:hypothetical protein
VIDISLVTNEDIWHELKKRHDAIILVTLNTYDQNREAVQISFCGGKFTCLGLAEHCINKIAEEAMTPPEDLQNGAFS